MLCFCAAARRGGSVRSCSYFFRISAEKKRSTHILYISICLTSAYAEPIHLHDIDLYWAYVHTRRILPSGEVRTQGEPS